jgi:serine/threonine-protein kinase
VTTIPSPLLSSLQAALSGQYRLERELGAGGMGVVFLATDLALDRPVAIKVIHPELATHPSIAQRFLAEARMIARLRHPNIVTVHAAGEATGLLYYVMDYVPGESLRQRLQREGRWIQLMFSASSSTWPMPWRRQGRRGWCTGM